MRQIAILIICFVSVFRISSQNNLGQNNLTENIPYHLWQRESFGQQDPSREIQSKRDANSKHFMGENGQMTALIASGAVHYLKDGAWHTILHFIEPIQGGFKNANNSFHSYYPDRATGTLKTIFSSGEELVEMQEMRMYVQSNASKTNIKQINGSSGHADFNQVKYPDAFGGGVDLLLTQQSNGRKMEFVLINSSFTA